MAFLWLINRGDPKYLLTGMILQVGADLSGQIMSRPHTTKR